MLWSTSGQPTIPEDGNVQSVTTHGPRPSLSRALSSNTLSLVRSRFRSREQSAAAQVELDARQQDPHGDSRRDPDINPSETGPDPETGVAKEHSASRETSEERQTGVSRDHIAFASDLRERPSTVGNIPLRPPYVNVGDQAEAPGPDEHDSRLQFPRRLGRNSTFHHLSEAERIRLGGVEYRAVSLLSIIVPVYFFLWQLLGAIAIGAYLARYYPSLTEDNGLNPWWDLTSFKEKVSAISNSSS